MKYSCNFTVASACSFLIAAGVAFAGGPSVKTPETAPVQKTRAALIGLPLSFEANLGQTDPTVKFLSRGDGYALFLTPDSAVFKLRASGSNSTAVVRMKLAGAAANAKIFGAETLPGTVNYLNGNDAGKWTTGIGTFARVNYQGIYPGIDLVYYGTQRQLEYDFVVAPRADPNQIALEFSGAQPDLGPDGNLVLKLDGAPLTFRNPVVYQMKGGKKELIAGRYRFVDGRVQFALGKYDRKRPLVIDPVLNYLTYLGGTNADFIGVAIYYGGANASNPTQGMAVDASGNVYMTGYTQSTNFPVQNAFQAINTANGQTGFVAKLNPAGNQLIYSTYFGASVLGDATSTRPYAIAVDASGSAYVTGYTNNPNFPVTGAAYQRVCGITFNNASNCPGAQSAFLSKFSPSGASLVYSTFLGHSNETGVAVAVDSAGRAYVVGNSGSSCTSTNANVCFPTTPNAVLPGSIFNTTINPTSFNQGAAFISVFDAAGANLLYSSLYGDGNYAADNHGFTVGVGVAVDPSGNFYFLGNTQNNGLPVTAGAFEHYFGNTNPNLASPSRGVLAKFSPVTSGASLIYATYLGGTDPAQGAYSDGMAGIAVDAAGNAYISGNASYNFPVTPGAYDTTPCPPNSGCLNRGFLAKMNPAGSALVWSTFIGGSRPDLSAVNSISAPHLDAGGNVYVSGGAGNNTEIPLVNPLQPANGFGGAFVMKFNPTANAVLFSTEIYSASNSYTVSGGMDLDSQGNIYMAGTTGAGDLPVTAGALQSANAGSYDAFITKVNVLLGANVSLVVAPGTAAAGTSVTFTATVTGAGASVPTGTVNFVSGPTTLGSATLNAGGVATLSSSTIPTGTYSVTAVYVGDTLYSSATSAAAPLTISAPGGCTYALDLGGEAFPSNGGSGIVSITTGFGCPWSLTNAPTWVTDPTSGSGNGALTFLVAANSGGARSATLTIAGQAFNVQQQAVSIPGLNVIGSMAHLAAKENWTTTFTLVDKSSAPATARLSFFGDAIDTSGNGPLALPLMFPQQPAATGPLLAITFDQMISGNASLIVSTAGPQTPPVLVGSAQLAGTGTVDGFAIFHQIVTTQEAVVPMETRSAPSYLLAFDNTAGLVLGIAVENLAPQNAVIPVIIRDDTGVVVSTPGTAVSLGGNGHTSFVLSTQFPVTAGIRGTIEFDAPGGGQISVLGLRFTPPNNALTTIPALANVGTGGGSIAHLASGGDGWQTTFVLVNTGASSAPATLSFFNDTTGLPLSLPLSFPQSGGGNVTMAPSVTQTLAAGATLLIVSGGVTPQLFTGSAQLVTSGNVSGFVIFRHNGQEAVVPLESRNANAYIVAFDNTNGTATGVAVNAVSAQAVNIPVIVRDDTGAQIATDTIAMAPNGHYAFTLGTDKYPAALTIRGTIEFDKPSNAQIGALGIRIPTGAAHTYTTLPALAK